MFYVRVLDATDSVFEPPEALDTRLAAERKLLQYALVTERPHKKLMIRRNTGWDSRGVTHYTVCYYRLCRDELVAERETDFVRADIKLMTLAFASLGISLVGVALAVAGRYIWRLL